jgi:hypothetical protein
VVRKCRDVDRDCRARKGGAVSNNAHSALKGSRGLKRAGAPEPLASNQRLPPSSASRTRIATWQRSLVAVTDFLPRGGGQPRHCSNLLAKPIYETRVFEAIILATPVRPSKCRIS